MINKFIKPVTLSELELIEAKLVSIKEANQIFELFDIADDALTIVRNIKEREEDEKESKNKSEDKGSINSV